MGEGFFSLQPTIFQDINGASLIPQKLLNLSYLPKTNKHSFYVTPSCLCQNSQTQNSQTLTSFEDKTEMLLTMTMTDFTLQSPESVGPSLVGQSSKLQNMA